MVLEKSLESPLDHKEIKQVNLKGNQPWIFIGRGFPGGLDGKEFACNAEDLGSISELGRVAGEGNGHPLQYSCLENPTDRGAWQTTVHRMAKVHTWLTWLSMHAPTVTFPKGLTKPLCLKLPIRPRPSLSYNHYNYCAHFMYLSSPFQEYKRPYLSS